VGVGVNHLDQGAKGGVEKRKDAQKRTWKTGKKDKLVENGIVLGWGGGCAGGKKMSPITDLWGDGNGQRCRNKHQNPKNEIKGGKEIGLGR